ncbi:MAG: pilus assembly protein PilM [Ardenticatenales bacterium]|nr:pilus assembly protein PilM [Ardenticatenales bacterium]
MAPHRERITLVVENEVLRLMGVQEGVVTRWASAPLPAGTLAEDGSVADLAALAQVLERLWSSQGQSAPRDSLVLAIPGRQIASSLVPVGGLQTADESLMEMKAREALPREDSYHDWQVVGPSSQPGLFVVAAPAPLVDSYLEALNIAELGVLAVDVKPLALIRGVGQRHAIIVDGERSVGTIIIVDEALPRLVRFPALNAPLLASQEDKIMRLVEVLQETVDRYNSEAGSRALHPSIPIFLTGSLADNPLLQEAVQQVLGRAAGRLTPAIQVPGDMPLSQFITNVGLALKRL